MSSFFTTLEKSLTTDFFSLGADSRCENVQRFRIVFSEFVWYRLGSMLFFHYRLQRMVECE